MPIRLFQCHPLPLGRGRKGKTLTSAYKVGQAQPLGPYALVNVDPQGGDRGTTQGILTGPKSVCQNPVGVMIILCQKVGKYPGSLAEIKDDRSA